MNEETAKALEGSIDKWQAIVDRTGKDCGHHNCPLCSLFYKVNCEGCPANTELGGCVGSPYENWSYHQHVYHVRTQKAKCVEIEEGCQTCLRLARAELAYLKSLR